MLQAMRQNTKVILWITIIFFVLLIFLVWGADLQFGGGPGGMPGVIGKVNGEPVSVNIYQQAVSFNRRSAAAQGRDLQPSDVLLIEEQTWNQIVNEMLLLQEAEKRGFTPRDAEVRTLLLNNPPDYIRRDPNFLDEQGQFDFTRYRQIIGDPGTPESFLLYLENVVRGNLPLEKMQRVIRSGAKVSDDEVRRVFLDQNARVKISYLLVDPRRMNIDAGEATDAEIETYYREHSQEYALPERADLRYVTFPRRASAEDSTQLVADLNEFAGEARSAAAEMDSGGDEFRYSDFATLAMTFSDGPNADQGGLSSGFLLPSEMSPAYRNAVEGLGVGQISEPFLEGGFYHIVKVEAEKTTEDNQRSVQLRDLAKRVAPSDSTVAAIRERFDAIHDLAGSSGLAEAAEENDLPIQTASDITLSGVVPGLSAIPRLATFALHNPVGTLSRVYETNSAWTLVEVADRKSAGVPSLDTIKEQVRRDLLDERRMDLARTAADRISGKIKLGDTLEAAAAEEEFEVASPAEFTRGSGVPGLGRDPEVLAAAFDLSVGAVSQPLESQRGWVILRVEERPEIDESLYTTQAAQIRSSLLSVRQSQLFNAWLEELRSEAKVEDFRS